MDRSQNARDLKLNASVVSPRIQGGNWNTHGFRRASDLYDEVECKLSIEEFVLEQGLPRDEDFN
jgi:hypothetical protein